MDALDRTLRWLGIQSDLRPRLEEYGAWLATEAIAAGGLGRKEGTRVLERHIVDSLLFAGVWSGGENVLDVGSGVGLPGIPLALAAPERHFVLLDRSRKRVELARRALRVLSLDNVEVVHGDLAATDWSSYVVVSRASISPDGLRMKAEADGPPQDLLVAGSHIAAPTAAGFEVLKIPTEILDRPVWILRMVQT